MTSAAPPPTTGWLISGRCASRHVLGGTGLSRRLERFLRCGRGGSGRRRFYRRVFRWSVGVLRHDGHRLDLAAMRHLPAR